MDIDKDNKPIIKYKQYVFIPESLKMSPGKLGSQVAHATYLSLEKENKILIEKWKNSGMCVIVLKCKNTLHLNNTAQYLKQWNIKHHLYIDEGLTEVLPMTPTCLATGILTEKDWWFLEVFELY